MDNSKKLEVLGWLALALVALIACCVLAGCARPIPGNVL